MNDNIIQFSGRSVKLPAGIPIIEKIIDGKVVKYVDVDALTAEQREKYFAGTLFSPEEAGR